MRAFPVDRDAPKLLASSEDKSAQRRDRGDASPAQHSMPSMPCFVALVGIGGKSVRAETGSAGIVGSRTWIRRDSACAAAERLPFLGSPAQSIRSCSRFHRFLIRHRFPISQQRRWSPPYYTLFSGFLASLATFFGGLRRRGSKIAPAPRLLATAACSGCSFYLSPFHLRSLPCSCCCSFWPVSR